MIFFTDKSDAMVQNTDIFSCGICEQNEENLVDFLRHKLRRECLCFEVQFTQICNFQSIN